MAAPLVFADVLYVPSGSGNAIKRIGSSGAVTNQVVVADAGAVVFSDDGSAYATDVAGGKIVKIAANGTVSDFATGLTSPTGLAVDSNGILFAAVGTGVAGESKILKFDQGAGAGTLFVNLPSNSDPQGLAFSSAGNLYVAQKGLNRISEITPAGAISVFSATSGQAASQVTAPVALAFDPTGTLYATDTQSGGRLASLAGGAGKAKTVESSLGTDLRGLCFDAAGAAYVAVGDSGTIKKIVLAGASNTVTDFATVADPGFPAIRSLQFRSVVMKGDPAETDQNAGNQLTGSFASYGPPATNDSGQTAFLGKLLAGANGVSSADCLGIWVLDADGSQHLVARKNYAADSTNGALFTALSDPVLNNAGMVAFRGALKAGSSASAGTLGGLWYGTPGSTLKVIRLGDSAPGAGTGSTFKAFYSFVLSDAGLIFSAKVSGPEVKASGDTGIWIVDNDVVKLLTIKGGEVEPGKLLSSFIAFKSTAFPGGQSRGFSSAGSITYSGKLSNGVAGILKSTSSSTSMVAGAGSSAETNDDPNDALTASFLSFGVPAVNASGQTAVVAKLAAGSSGVTSADNVGLWLIDEDSTQHLVARKNYTAQDTQNAVWSGFSDPLINDNGEVAFRGLLKAGIGDGLTGTLSGIWYGPPAALTAIRQGDAAPGCGNGVTFSAFTALGFSSGGVVFTAKVAGTGVSAANDLGIWAADPDGTLQLVQREGNTMDFDGVSKTVSSFTIFKPVASVPAQIRYFNQNNGLVYQVKFTDGTIAVLASSFP